MAKELAMASLKTAAKLRGIRIHKMPGERLALYRATTCPNVIEPIGAWMTYKEVMNYFGATAKITLREALERDGYLWPV